jgi:hypothetical protein
MAAGGTGCKQLTLLPLRYKRGGRRFDSERCGGYFIFILTPKNNLAPCIGA